MRLVQHVKNKIQNSPFFIRGSTILIGVSGGPDSIALAHILHQIQYELGFHLHIVHYNHHWRRSSNTDQKFVEQFSDSLNIPCTVGHWNNPKATSKGSMEDAARQRRLKFFHRVSQKNNEAPVALAHTEDDHAETVLMRILRGTGLQGLRGILPECTIEGLNIIHPLLDIRKEDLIKYLKHKRISYRIDPTNGQTDFFRNKVRLELLPLLSKKYNQNIKQLLTNIADNASTDYSYIEGQSEKLFSKLAKYTANKRSVQISLKSYSHQHPALKRMIIRESIRKIKGNTNRITLTHFKAIEDLIDKQPSKSIVHLPLNLRIRKDSKNLTLTVN